MITNLNYILVLYLSLFIAVCLAKKMKADPIHAMNLLIGQRVRCYRFYGLWVIFAILLTPAVALGQSGALPESTSTVKQATPASSTPALATQTTPTASPLAPVINATTLPRDLNPWGMFLNSDWVVKVVIIGLIFASIVTWTICLAKSLELRSGKRRLREVAEGLWEIRTLVEGVDYLRKVKGVTEWFADVVERELHFSVDSTLEKEGIKERVALQLGRIEAAASRRITRGTGMLATIGSTAPFVGLFGTVWGIMNSFIGISEAQTTNLAVVAPGIAEALLVTAIGLVTAIPAVVIYNFLARSTAGYRALLADTVSEVLQLVGRELDRQQLSSPALDHQQQRRLRKVVE